MKAKLTIGTRQSLLALWQSNHIAALLRKQYPECEVVLKKIVTKGDRILDVPLAQIGGKGLFTKEIEEDLLDGTIDLAVHSLKDMPTVLPEGLCLTAITERANVGDAFVSNKYGSFDHAVHHRGTVAAHLREKGRRVNYARQTGNLSSYRRRHETYRRHREREADRGRSENSAQPEKHRQQRDTLVAVCR